MANSLQSLLTHVGLALAPLRALTAPAQAATFFRSIGYDIPPGAFGGALTTLSARSNDLAAAVAALAQATSDADVAVEIANTFARLAGTVDAIGALHVQIKAGGGAGLPNIDEFPQRLTDFMVLDLVEQRLPDLHSALHLLGLIEREPSPGAGQSSRLINWNRFTQILQSPGQIANDVYRWDTDFDIDRFLGRLELAMRAAALPGGIYPQSSTAQGALGNATSGLRELRLPILQKGVTPETYSQFGITFSPAEAQGGKKNGVALLPFITGASSFDFTVCDRGELIFESTGDIRGIGIVVRPPFDAHGRPEPHRRISRIDCRSREARQDRGADPRSDRRAARASPSKASA